DKSFSRIEWATYLGGHKNRNWYWRGPLEAVSSIAVDAMHNVYVAGETAATDFPVVNAVQTSAQSSYGSDGFLTKLSPDGTRLLFSTYLGGASTGSATRVVIDPSGSVYVSLWFDNSTRLPFETADLSTPGRNATNAVVRLNPAGGVV